MDESNHPLILTPSSLPPHLPPHLHPLICRHRFESVAAVLNQEPADTEAMDALAKFIDAAGEVGG
jgi:hypothetical protein